MPTLSALYLYPIKSLGGLAVQEAVVDERGFRHDRRFMLVEPDGTFMTQRTNHHMALIDVAIAGETLRVWHRHQPGDVLVLPLDPVPNPSDRDTLAPVSVSIWDSKNVAAVAVSPEADRWFTNALGKNCRLVYMPETTRRLVDPQYARQNDAVSFADGYPYLLIGQSSLDDLNQRLPEPVEMIRFRPSVVVSGSLPYDEDAWSQFRIGGLTFYGVKPCARCVLTTIDPATGERGPEPLRTLAQYRQWKHKILFGQNVLTDPESTAQILRVGQAVEVVDRCEAWLGPPVPEAQTT